MKITEDIVLKENAQYGKHAWAYNSETFDVILRRFRGGGGGYELHITVEFMPGGPIEAVKSLNLNSVRAAFRRAVRRIQESHDHTSRALAAINLQSNKKPRGRTLWEHIDAEEN